MHPAEYRKLINAPETAEYLGISVSTLSKLRVFGGGPKYLKLGRRVVYDTRDLEAWLDAHRRASTSDEGEGEGEGEGEVAVIPDHPVRKAGSKAPAGTAGRKLPRRRGEHVAAQPSR